MISINTNQLETQFPLDKYIFSVGFPVHIINTKDMFETFYRREDERSNFVIVCVKLDENEEIDETFKKIRHKFLWTRDAKVIVLVEDSVSDEVMKKVLMVLWDYNPAINTVAVSDTLVFYTVFPYECDEKEKFHRINSWNGNNFDKNTSLFPQKIPEQFECLELKATIVGRQPYAAINDPCGVGMEIKAMNMISNIYNFTVKYIVQPDFNHFFITFEGNGSLALMYRKEVDLAFSAFDLTLPRFQYGDVLPFYLSDGMVWLLRQPELRPKWMNIIRPFKWLVWFIIAMIVFLLTGSIVLISRLQPTENKNFRSFSYSFLHIIGIHVHEHCDFKAVNTPMKFLSIVSLFYGILLTTAYESSIIKLLTTADSYPQLETLPQLLDEGYYYYIFPGRDDLFRVEPDPVWDHILEPSNHELLRDFNGVYRNVSLSKSKSAAMTRVVYFEAVKLRYQDDEGESLLYLLDEVYMMTFSVTYMTLNHPLYTLFESKYPAIFEAGFLDHWLAEYIITCRDNIMYKHEGAPQKLTIQHLQSIFYIDIAGLCISIAAFITEVGVTIHNKTTKSYKYLTNYILRKTRKRY